MQQFFYRFLFFFKKEKSKRIAIHKITGYYPNNLSLYKKAFTHKSVSEDNNERLEFLGDTILSYVIADYLYKKYPQKNEGELSQYLAFIINRNTLNAIGLTLKIVSLTQYIETPKGHKNISGNVLEALIGALYLDLGLEITQQSIINHLVIPHINFTTIHELKQDFKSRLTIWGQKNKQEIQFQSDYIDEKYSVKLYINGEELAQAQHENKKEAEKLAAELAWVKHISSLLTEVKTM